MQKQKSERVAMALAAAAHLDDVRLSVEAVCVFAGIGKTKLYEVIKHGQLTPIPGLGKRCTRFRAADVKAYLATSKGAA